ncbi:6059_t:CDS:2 [Paraglomus occultum]|uniref:6059_t:CDS:1 n=1 Tax=Paraglomus occultum TaxID=144539 RepID=A0A9N9DPW3_9GLOM|nr:6059_t:CDS:2 [Paraglomus occultum]
MPAFVYSQEDIDSHLIAETTATPITHPPTPPTPIYYPPTPTSTTAGLLSNRPEDIDSHLIAETTATTPITHPPTPIYYPPTPTSVGVCIFTGGSPIPAWSSSPSE